jgi:uncharacterized membrane protein YedE/YeeE
MTYWPFWLGGMALAGVALGNLLLLRRPMGVSGLLSNVLVREARRTGSARTSALGPPLAPATSGLFLVGIVAGAAVSALLAGDLGATFDPGATFHTLFGRGPAAWAALFGGGLLVGFGTRMAGGCTSGHGLVGCGAMRPGSLVSTACFFGTAIVVSIALAWVQP